MTYIFIQPDMNMRQWRWLQLIKDYELEVLYHPGKVNVVIDVLCCRAHYSYLLAIPLTGEESRIWVLPNLSLYNTTVTPLLREEIISA
jgi:hypothetical protein